VGTNNDLGILEDVAPDALAKKFAKAAWLEFCEKYGIAPRWVTTDSFSDTRHKELAEMMASMVNNHWAVLQGNEKIETMQVSGGNAKAIFDELIQRMNSEMSKGILGQDGTTNSNEKAGTYGSLQVMQDVADDRHEADKTDISYLINDELLWRLEEISPAYKGISNYRFDWDESKELTPDELIETVVKLSGAGYQVDIKYLTEQTGIPITEFKQAVDPNLPTPPNEGEKKKANQKQDLNALISKEIVAYYTEKLLPTDSFNMEAVDLSNYTRLIEKLAKDLHEGKIKGADFNEDLVRQTYKDLSEAAGSGYGKDFYNYETNAERKLELRQNLYKFSGVKTYQQTAKLNFLLQGEDGEPRSFSEFRKEALKLNEQYNQNYLKTEYQTAQRSAAQAEKWAKYEDQKGVYPNLQYKTAKDDRVRDDHDAVDDVIKPVDDKFWDKWYPPNGWNCRCYVVQTDKPGTRGTPEGNPTMGFQNNVGKSNNLFDEEHPYFLFPPEEDKKVRSAFENLKLSEPMYEQLYTKGKAKLEGSVWAKPKDISKNFEQGKTLVNETRANVQIRPQVDPAIVKGHNSATFSINGKTANLKEVKTAKDINKEISATKSGSIVFNLDNSKLNSGQIIEQLGKLGKEISSVFFIKGTKAAELTRAQITGKKFARLEELLKPE
jgi:SPP1 gp7 family putative phage head morphogenesis protein